MERKIGEKFEYQGKKLIVEENKSKSCGGCFFNEFCPLIVRQTAGECQAESRVDNKYVIFVEVKEPTQETEAVKERKIGEIFNYDGKTLEVVETKSDTCYNCYFKEETGRCSRIKSKTGVCDIQRRTDKRPVIFIEIKDKTKEQHQQTKNPKELKIGESFEYKGRKLKAIEKEGIDDCDGCVLFKEDCKRVHDLVGECEGKKRNDGKGVVFVDADEFDDHPLIEEGLQEETEEPNERKIGETFEYEGRKLKVVESGRDECRKCFFFYRDCKSSKDGRGVCGDDFRTDKKNVIFVECYDEQPQEQTEQQPKEEPQLNLCEVLKNCPMGEPFWSPLYGDVKLYNVDHKAKKICVITKTDSKWWINPDATITIAGVISPEIMLYPSREQRDWSKVKYEPKHVLPRSWEEFCLTHDITMSEYFIGNTGNIFNSNSGKRIPEISKTILPSEQAAEAHLAYMQLHQLRNAWREGWTPDWTDNTQAKFAIVYNKDEHIVFDCRFIRRFLAFQDESRAKEFLKCYKGLIKKARDLI